MQWDLSKLYAGFDDPRMAEDWKLAETLCDEIDARFAEPARDENAVTTLEAALRALEQLSDKTQRLGGMIMLTLSIEAENEAALALYDRLTRLETRAEKVYSAISRFLADRDVEALTKESGYLKSLSYLLVTFKRKAAHTLDKALEGPVLDMQLTGGRAWEQLRDTLDATHMIELEMDGEKQSLPLSAVRNCAFSADGDLRKRAYEAEIAAYPRIEAPMAACLNAIKGEALTLSKLRHYDAVLDTALEESHIDRQTLEAMLGAMKDAFPAFRKYFRAKAKLLGHEGGLPFYDLFAPVGEASRTYTLEESKALLIDVLGGFSADMGELIRRAFDENRVDVYPRAGKQGGAFCAGLYPIGVSYVLSNFDGTLGAVSTFAHELGHAYHDSRLFKNGILLADAPMPLAETASIFNETLFTGALMKDASRAEKLTILDQQLTDAAQTVVDIYSRYLFESEVIRRREDHILSPRELKEIMLDAQRQSYGDGLDENAMHPYMWACKSHYYSTGLHFYNFPYAFGLLFGKGVYARYQKQGKAFLAEYDRLLQYTALADAAEVAATVGIDLRDRAFWDASLAVVEKEIDEYVSLC